MRKIFLAAMILFGVMCSGCFEGSSNLIITDDGEVYMRNKLIGVPTIAASIESVRQNFEQEPNADISPVAENNMSGYEERVHYPSIEAFAAGNNPLFMRHEGKCEGIRQHKSWFFDAYDFDLILTSNREFSTFEAAAFQSMLSQVSFDLVIELPCVADNHNADKVDVTGKILTWHLAPVIIGSVVDKHMRAQFKLWHRDKFALTILVGLMLMTGGIFFHVKARSEESESVGKDLRFKRNVFAGMFVALVVISIYLLNAPVTFTDADIISARSSG